MPARPVTSSNNLPLLHPLLPAAGRRLGCSGTTRLGSRRRLPSRLGRGSVGVPVVPAGVAGDIVEVVAVVLNTRLCSRQVPAHYVFARDTATLSESMSRPITGMRIASIRMMIRASTKACPESSLAVEALPGQAASVRHNLVDFSRSNSSLRHPHSGQVVVVVLVDDDVVVAPDVVDPRR